ncbi:beta-galactosidase (plasmid) [Streptomyces sp. BI20]|uniref:beta-galactosidase n=1 Tax=Streptomyces sp. BI20 TaxID=3403460 RepID=UPI003C747940
MAHGGTNFGFWAGANHTGVRPEGPGHQPTVTSYDYDAPIGEAGELTPRFHALREVIGRYLPLPEGPLPGPPARMRPAAAVPAGSADLLGLLDTLPSPAGGPLRRAVPESMERVGQDRGMIHYRTRIGGPRPAEPLRVDGLGDRAYAFADGVPLGVLDRERPDEGPEPAVGPAGVVLDLLVLARGRVNYGPLLADRKGIGRGVRPGRQHLFTWEVRRLPFDAEDTVRLHAAVRDPAGAEPPRPGRLSLHRFTHLAEHPPADGFVDTAGWGTGLIWLNGFLLGHYDAPRGPQRTLYAPAPLWRSGGPDPGAGPDELLVLELDRPGPGLSLRDRPDLGRPTPFPPE